MQFKFYAITESLVRLCGINANSYWHLVKFDENLMNIIRDIISENRNYKYQDKFSEN